ncbi:MAG: hypothetical protein EOO43_18905 [Flavobacterium sp.]|nr:MAG: hypothetical protein EOO43_18905 [Flavobacterium sp.]
MKKAFSYHKPENGTNFSRHHLDSIMSENNDKDRVLATSTISNGEKHGSLSLNNSFMVTPSAITTRKLPPAIKQ